MGYYVETIESDFRIDRENYDDAYRAVCELNARDDLKTGGKWPANSVRPADSKSMGDPNKWFAWMSWNYDETCKSLTEILSEVGFEVEEDERGICGLQYPYQKSGQEEIFLGALAPYVRAGSRIVFEGEDASRWGYLFDGSRMVECDVSLTLTPSSLQLAPAALADKAKAVSRRDGDAGETKHPAVKL